jgi:hypothetical protein
MGRRIALTALPQAQPPPAAQHSAASCGSSRSALCGWPASVAGALSWRFFVVPFMTELNYANTANKANNFFIYVCKQSVTK